MPNAHPGSQDHLLAVIVAVVAIATLYFAKSILIPIALAILFAFILTPIVQLLERVRLGRFASTLAVVLLSVVVVGAGGWTVTKQFAGVMQQLPNYKTNLGNKIATLRGAQKQTLGNASTTVSELGKELASPIGPGRISGSKAPVPSRPLPVEVVNPSALPLESLQNVLSLLASAGLVVVFTLFMILRREDLRNRFIALAGAGRLNLMTQALDDAGGRISRYLRLQLIVNSCYGVVVGFSVHLIGVPGAVLWGAIAAILRFIPYLGPPLGAIAPFFLSLAIFPGWNRPLAVLGVFVAIEICLSNLIEPLLYGEQTGLSPVAILLAAVFWTALWGPVGLVVSTPLPACLVVLGRHVPSLKFLHTLLGDEPTLAPSAHFYQRLLAMDDQEAREVLENALKDRTLEDVYESILVPALSLAGHDRHRNELDGVTQKFICQSTKELVEDLYENCNRLREANIASNNEEPTSPPAGMRIHLGAVRIVCLPARDEADEIIGIMLAQLLERAGYKSEAILLDAGAEALAAASQWEPDIICLSALPPFAVSHARSRYKELRAQFPLSRIVVGLWDFSGDLKAPSRRMDLSDEDMVVTKFSQFVQIIDFLIERGPAERPGSTMPVRSG